MRIIFECFTFGLGALFCLINFYLSILRRPARDSTQEGHRWVSGVPLVGSLLVALSLFGLRHLPGVLPLAIILILIDTRGIHWLVGTLIYQSLFGKKRD